MTNVIPFTPRANADGGWSAAERARLAELADRLSAAEGIKVEAVYGVTDEGDPWCVIKDENEEVLVHVARIDGQFVIHDAAADAVQEDESLWTACDRLLGEAWRDPREEVVVPLSHRQAQSVIALALAVAFIHEVREAEAAVEPQHDIAPVEAAAGVSIASLAAPPPASADQPRQELLAPQNLQAQKAGGAGPGEVAPAPEAEAQAANSSEAATNADADAPAQVAQPPAQEAISLTPAEEAEPSAQVLQGTAGADTLQGGDGRDEIHGGAGDDSLNGGDGGDALMGGSGADTLDGGAAGPDEIDVLDGGEGDDQIILGGQVVATGGEGADTFVITARPAADGLLGVIKDFAAERGDRFVFQNGKPFTPIAETEVTDKPDVPGFDFGATSTGQLFNGRQVWIDLDGDGIADGHLLIAGRTPPLTAGSMAPDHSATDHELPAGSILLA